MKKIGKLLINSDKIMKNEELMSLSGGYGSYLCYKTIGADGCCEGFIEGINTSSCDNAWYICSSIYTGACVKGGDCYSC